MPSPNVLTFALPGIPGSVTVSAKVSAKPGMVDVVLTAPMFCRTVQVDAEKVGAFAVDLEEIALEAMARK